MTDYILSYVATPVIAFGDDDNPGPSGKRIEFTASSDEEAAIRASEEWKKIINGHGEIIESQPYLIEKPIPPRQIDWEVPVK
jgi:hypothetical protein